MTIHALHPEHDSTDDLVSAITTMNLRALDKTLAAVRSKNLDWKWKAWTAGALSERILIGLNEVRSVI